MRKMIFVHYYPDKVLRFFSNHCKVTGSKPPLLRRGGWGRGLNRQRNITVCRTTVIVLLPLFIFCQSFCQQFQLAPPMLKYPSGFFSGSTSFEVIFNQPGAAVHYTLNGKEPTEKDLLYSRPVTISNKTIVKAKAFSKDFLPSETVTAHFIKDGKAIEKNTILQTQ